MKTKLHSNIREGIIAVEHLLRDFYQTAESISATDFLIEDSYFLEQGKQVPRSLGSVLLCEAKKSEETSFLGIYLSRSICELLSEHNPLEQLNHKNLNAFCVLVEELSHFHLLAHRIEREMKTSHLELEWQAEVDKVLICAKTLKKQVNDHHLPVLLKKIFFEAKIIDLNHFQRYQDASKFAHLFWEKLQRDVPDLHQLDRSNLLRAQLKRAYLSSWRQKIELICERPKAA